MRLESDLLDLLEAVVEEKLGEIEPIEVEWNRGPRSASCCAADGYPGKHETGKPITGLDECPEVAQRESIPCRNETLEESRRHRRGPGPGVTALGDTLAMAKKNAYDAVAKIKFSGMHFRTDIADKALKG